MWSRTILLLLLLSLGSAHAAAPMHPDDDIPVVFTTIAKAETIYDDLLYPVRIQSRINATVVAEADAIVSKIVSPLGKAVPRHSPILVLKHIDPVFNYRPLVIQAPVSGVVTSMEVTQGTRVAKGQKLASITDPSQITAVAEIAGGDLSSVSLGLTGEMILNGSSHGYQVKVTGISPQLDPATGTATCELALVNVQKNVPLVPSGSLGRVTFKVRARKGIEIPEYALIYRDNQVFVRIVDKDIAKFVQVQLGTSQKGLVEITSGLADGMSVVLRSSVFVAQGERVKVQAAESAEFE